MLPIILYNINKEQITSNIIVLRGLTFFFYSYEKLTVKVIEGPGILFSVENKNNQLIANSDYSFSNNLSYTLYNNGGNTKISVTNSSGNIEIFEFIYKPDNVLSDSQEHYNDLLINHYLPTFEELEPALIPGTVKSDLIKRLLLDFKDILRSKGTKKSIEKFFYFVGFLKEQIKVVEEYRKNKSNPDDDLTQKELLSWVISKNITTNPDKTVDTKTGNYHVLFNNWNDNNQNGIQDVNEKNMPFRPFSQENFDLFFESLKYAIALANKYFTLVEQEITFFGITMNVNIPMYQSITSSMNQIFEYDLNAFRKNIHIDLYYNYVTTGYNKTPYYLVKNCLQKDKKAYRSEIKYTEHQSIAKNNNELFLVEKEYADNEIYTGPIEIFKRTFGNILHLNIESPNTYVQITIENLHNEFVKLIIPKQYIETNIHVEFLNACIGNYKIIVEFWDTYNSYEKYWYFYDIEDDVRLLDIDLITSLKITDNQVINNLNLDIDSGTITTAETDNFILPLDKIPNSLKQYFYQNKNIPNIKYLSKTTVTDTKHLFILPEINKNFKVNKVTETIPVTHTDQWFEFIVFPCDNETLNKLILVLYDAENSVYKNIYLNTIDFELDPVFDKLFIRKLQIYENESDIETKQYLFISAIETGINLYKDTFDIRIAEEHDETKIVETKIFNFDTLDYDIITEEVIEHIIETQSIYDIQTLIRKQIPVNFDFPLFPYNKDIDNNDYVFSSITNTFPIVKSIFPRLQKNNIDLMYLGDIIIARLNSDTIVNETDITWTLKDEFNGSVLYTTNDYTLKYRLKENTIYTIECLFSINGNQYKIERTGIISSWKMK